MEMMNNFSKSTFGGFKKEQVVAYIDEVVARYNDEINKLKEQDQSQRKQLKELKDIVEQQYQKIVLTTQELEEKGTQCNELLRECEGTKESLLLKAKKVDDLEECFRSTTAELAQAKAQLELINDARSRAGEITDKAQDYAEEIRSSLAKEKEQAIKAAKERAQEIVDRADEEAQEIKEKALCQAQNIIDSANEKMELISKCEQEIIEAANGHIEAIKQNEQENINKTRTVIIENQAKAQEIVKTASTEASDILLAATKQAEEMRKKAVEEYSLEREKYETLIKSIDVQKTNLLLSLDDIKAKVQSIKIVKTQKSNEPSTIPAALAPSEIIRRRLSILGNK